MKRFLVGVAAVAVFLGATVVDAGASPSRLIYDDAGTGYVDGSGGTFGVSGSCNVALLVTGSVLNGVKVSCVGVLPAGDSVGVYKPELPVSDAYGTSFYSPQTAYGPGFPDLTCPAGSYIHYDAGYDTQCGDSSLTWPDDMGRTTVVANSEATTAAYTATLAGHTTTWHGFRYRALYTVAAGLVPWTGSSGSNWCDFVGGLGGSDAASHSTLAASGYQFLFGGYIIPNTFNGWLGAESLSPASVTCDSSGSDTTFPAYPTAVASGTPDAGPPPCSVSSVTTSLPWGSTTTGAPVRVAVSYLGAHDYTLFSGSDLPASVTVTSSAPVVVVNLVPRAHLPWHVSALCESGSSAFDLGVLESATITPGSGVTDTGTAGGGSFDFAACIAGATDGLDLYSPGTWVNYGATLGKCSAEWLFIPSDDAVTRLTTATGLTSTTPDSGSSVHLVQWVGTAGRVLTELPATTVDNIRAGATDSSSCPGGGYHLDGHTFSWCSALTSLSSNSSFESAWPVIDDIVSAVCLVMVGWGVFTVLRKLVNGTL